jgi:two-component system response regulator RegA
LVVDDDETFRGRLGRALVERGYDVRCAGSYEEAIAAATLDSPQLAVVDLKMPGRSGLEVVRELKALDPTTSIVVLTGYGSIATAVEAMRLGAIHYLSKPADTDQILGAFGEAHLEITSEDIETPSLKRIEWEHIQRVLTDSSGNISEAARRLGIHRRSLQYKLRKYPPTK